jgi:hypothetical protein
MVNMEAVYVLGAAIINFIVGGIWYGVFGKQWMQAWELKEKDVNRKDPGPYLIAFIGSLWTSYGLFLIIKHIQPKNFEEIFTVAIGTWLFILVGMGGKHYAFAGKSFKAFAIDYGLDLVGIVIMCLIIWQY